MTKMKEIADLIIKTIVDNYSTKVIPIWYPLRIKLAISKISEDIANDLDYTNANECAKSLAKRLNEDISSSLVTYNYPVWVDLFVPEAFEPKSKNVVITYVEDATSDEIHLITKDYANKIGADFVLLTGRTQGYPQLEFHRVKAFAEIYDRTLFVGPDTLVKNNCPNLFDIVPEGKIGLTDDKDIKGLQDPFTRFLLLKAEAFQRTKGIGTETDQACIFESEMMPTRYDNHIVVCDKKHKDIWSPLPFPFRFSTGKSKGRVKNENKAWMEIFIYRNDHEVFSLPKKYNHSCLDDTLTSSCHVIRYDNFERSSNVINTWRTDNNLIGYKDKNPVDMTNFKVLSLYHKDDQLKSIEPRSYLEFINLNEINSKFDNSFTESRIYYEDFDSLFPSNFEYVGLTTASWNYKYIGLNPIDKLHQWNSIRKLDNNSVLCGSIENVNTFKPVENNTLQRVFKNITPTHMESFFDMIDLDWKVKNEQSLSSNQIITNRKILKSLFEFYQNCEILDKIQFFLDKHNFDVNDDVYGGNAYIRRSGFFSECITAIWIAQNNFTIMPQEIIKPGWYK